jgi:hypothetical protein
MKNGNKTNAHNSGIPNKAMNLSLVLCRFSDAGNDNLTTCSNGRRPKSAKARNPRKCWIQHSWGLLCTARKTGRATSGLGCVPKSLDFGEVSPIYWT